MSDRKVPAVTIGVPVYNGENFLEATLDSLLAQSFEDFELIVCDNASTDGTSRIGRDYAARDPRVRYVGADENRGAAWNFNRCYELARGRYFKWAAHDDIHGPEFLRRCVDVLDREPDVVLCFTGTRFIGPRGEDLGEHAYPYDLAERSRRARFRSYVRGGHIVHEIFGVIRREALRDTPLIGGYLGSDLVLLGILALKGRIHQVPDVQFYHREHETRSMISPQGAANATQWYDASKSGRFAMPRWRRLYENAKSAVRYPPGLAAKVGCLVEVARVANWQRRALATEVVRVIRPATRTG